MSRTYRNIYTKSKAWDTSCRSHGGCPWCLQGRQHSTFRRMGAERHNRISNKNIINSEIEYSLKDEEEYSQHRSVYEKI